MVTMNFRRVFFETMVAWILLLAISRCVAEKLSPNQKAPPFARGSGGLILKTPFETDAGKGGAPAPRGSDNDVVREETDELKLVDGQPVRSVMGSFSYRSPEGLPVSVRYVADENGNRASFRLGKAASGGPSGPSGPSGPRGQSPGGGSQKSLGGQTDGGSKDRAYLPPKDVDRSYLPPR